MLEKCLIVMNNLIDIEGVNDAISIALRKYMQLWYKE